ncbi:Hypothetical predicted protein [Octopus vulgaris]|uniref:Uncharacterized protein n=1 Tax=Octopus vulgaris TaxID=6645 RepID=A0AA36B8C3_OCTVU|nr:Hypothetical predicted protein [Octopus vulgaris]
MLCKPSTYSIGLFCRIAKLWGHKHTNIGCQAMVRRQTQTHKHVHSLSSLSLSLSRRGTSTYTHIYTCGSNFRLPNSITDKIPLSISPGMLMFCEKLYSILI